MQIVFGPYPMTIDQLRNWAKDVGSYDPGQCAKALAFINSPTIKIARDTGENP